MRAFTPALRFASIIRLLMAALLFAALAPVPAQAWTYKIIYDFCGVQNCTNGYFPQGTLLMDSAGNLYGTAQYGGAYGHGAVYELTPSGEDKWTETVLYSFCKKSGCPDGGYPRISFMDVAGNLYGTDYDADSRRGIAFQLVHETARSKWKLNILHAFGKRPGGTDGNAPVGLTFEGARNGALYDGTGVLYGTTLIGGANNGGTLFDLAPVDGTAKWKLTTLYDFCAPNCTTDAWEPGALQDAGGGTFYDISARGGSGSGWGSIFSFKPKHEREAVLYNFGTGGIGNGLTPNNLVIDPGGDLFGTTREGGNNDISRGDAGVLYKYIPGKPGQYSVAYKFCSQFNCTDGALPTGLTVDVKGNIYGVTFWGGNSDHDIDGLGGGVLFALDPSFHVLYAFCSTDIRCSDGYEPYSSPLRDSKGNLFGTTRGGGAYNGGIVYELSP